MIYYINLIGPYEIFYLDENKKKIKYLLIFIILSTFYKTKILVLQNVRLLHVSVGGRGYGGTTPSKTQEGGKTTPFQKLKRAGKQPPSKNSRGWENNPLPKTQEGGKTTPFQKLKRAGKQPPSKNSRAGKQPP